MSYHDVIRGSFAQEFPVVSVSVPIDECTWLCLILTYRLTFLTLRIGDTVHLLVLQLVLGNPQIEGEEGRFDDAGSRQLADEFP